MHVRGAYPSALFSLVRPAREPGSASLHPRSSIVTRAAATAAMNSAEALWLRGYALTSGLTAGVCAKTGVPRSVNPIAVAAFQFEEEPPIHDISPLMQSPALTLYQPSPRGSEPSRGSGTDAQAEIDPA